MYRSNYHVISFVSNKAFNVITNRTVIATNREAIHTQFAVMVIRSCLSHFASRSGDPSLTHCHAVSIHEP